MFKVLFSTTIFYLIGIKNKNLDKNWIDRYYLCRHSTLKAPLSIRSAFSPPSVMDTRYVYIILEQCWSYFSFLFQVPLTPIGQLVTILYAIFGIPLYFAFSEEMQVWVDKFVFVWMNQLLCGARCIEPIPKARKFVLMCILCLLYMQIIAIFVMVCLAFVSMCIILTKFS